MPDFAPLRAALQAQIDQGQLLGTVTAIAWRNQVVFHEAQGQSDPDSHRPQQVDDLFRMMSSTKSVTAVAVLMMQDEGRLHIEDPVSRFLPSFANQRVAVAPPGAKDPSLVQLVPTQRALTIKDLLTHTGGLSTSSMGGLTSVGALINNVERRADDTLASYVDRLGAAALDFQPGSRWSYSPTDGFDTLLRIVEICSGQSADIFLEERLFQPLEMRDTHFNIPVGKRHRVVPVLGRTEAGWQTLQPLFGEGPHRLISGAGNLSSTAMDFLHYELMLLNRGSFGGHQVLRPETAALMASNHVGPKFSQVYPDWTGGFGFGLGVAVLEDRSRGHGRGVGTLGWGGAYGTVTWSDPELEMAVVSMVQQPGANLTSVIAPVLRQVLEAQRS